MYRNALYIRYGTKWVKVVLQSLMGYANGTVAAIVSDFEKENFMEYSKHQKKNDFIWVTLTFSLFLSIWIVWILLNRHYHFGDFIENILSYGDVIWLLSGILFIYINRKKLYISPKKMFATIPKHKIIFPLLAFIFLYYIGHMILYHGGFYINTDKNILNLIGMFAIVGIQEELLFRGWFFNKLAMATTERKANIISAVFFMLIHYPGWIIASVPALSFITSSISAFILGLVFGWSFRKSCSIWTPILLHMVWDVFSYLV